MTLELDKKQYENLLKLVSLGNAMANSYREEPIEEFQGVFDLLYSKAEEAGLGEIVEKDDEGSFFPTQDFELMLNSFVEEYDESCFWDRLIDTLVERDLVAKYGEEGFEKLSEEELETEQENLIKFYATEFEANDVENLFLKK